VPYIDADGRQHLKYTNKPRTAGELQYEIALMVSSFVNNNGLKYQTLNDVMGAIAGAQQEFYRRVVAVYEDTKIEENGDVYTCLSQEG